jgi:hypothetical protein
VISEAAEGDSGGLVGGRAEHDATKPAQPHFSRSFNNDTFIIKRPDGRAIKN